jgi:hypothetical protein
MYIPIVILAIIAVYGLFTTNLRYTDRKRRNR